MRKPLLRASAALSLLLLLAAHGASADCVASHCEDIRVLTLYTPPAGDANTYIKVTGTMSNFSCTLYGGVYVRVPASSTRFKEFLTTLLAAQLADRPVSFGIDGSQATCTVNSLWTNTP